MTVYPRSKIGTPEPSPSRRKLVRVGWLLAHEVGVNTRPGGRYRSDDPATVLDDAKAAATYGVAAGKPWEYNWMIGRDGSIFTQAGEYVAAHCLAFNTQSAGVIWLNALGLAPTAAQIESWWFLRGHAVDIGVLAADHQVAPHYRFRATSCCGVLANPPGKAWDSPTGEGRTGDLIDALTIPTIPDPAPVPPPDHPAADLEDDMHIIVGRLANPADPRRWAWNGINVRWIRDEAEFWRLYKSPLAVFKLHPDFADLANPYLMSDEDINRYANPEVVTA